MFTDIDTFDALEQQDHYSNEWHTTSSSNPPASTSE